MSPARRRNGAGVPAGAASSAAAPEDHLALEVGEAAAARPADVRGADVELRRA